VTEKKRSQIGVEHLLNKEGKKKGEGGKSNDACCSPTAVDHGKREAFDVVRISNGRKKRERGGERGPRHK